ncbi:Nif3-like dinuclear metal center hexameric protein [Thermoflavifilum thermophilum]|uniref:GTP cyclohydrolase 1 type 2 homolog n=1 Tax=Thermoflavifilum thermophilum TaxID=1393122 RepID=A0A1I7NFV3_9BACT|nr:Nif3-like dinuclear metal center hexameric protein [Thermoflavifilum thermophilum]SFV33547.1 dinuclear metal center protein, YbgI/SA1388 family [Thermoflavifilum thermophilum]
MQINEIIQYLEEIAPLSYQESYDNAGLQVGNPGQPLQGILLTLDITETVVKEAIQKHCNLIVAHHPIMFRPLKRITGATDAERAIMLAIQSNVVLYAIHTNLDQVAQGVNAMIAERLGLLHTQVLAPMRGKLKKLVTFVPHAHAAALRAALFHAGAGVIGKYDECSYNVEGFGTFRAREGANPYVGTIGKQHQEPETRVETIFPAHLEKVVTEALLQHHPYEEVAYDIYPLDNLYPEVGPGMVGELPEPVSVEAFLHLVKEALHTGCIRYTHYTGMIQRVAVCGGAGIFLLPEAIKAGAQAFVTADIKYHEFFQAEGRLLLMDVGHYESEQFTVDLLERLIRKKFPNFAPLKSEICTNPINYFS